MSNIFLADHSLHYDSFKDDQVTLTVPPGTKPVAQRLPIFKLMAGNLTQSKIDNLKKVDMAWIRVDPKVLEFTFKYVFLLLHVPSFIFLL